MKALTLWQPWADLIAFGEKHVETRSWGTTYRGPLAIHAASNRHRDGEAFIASANFSRYRNLRGARPFVYGAIVAVARVERVERMSDVSPGEFSLHERSQGFYAPERYAWFLTDVQRLAEPIRCRGWQKMWRLAVELERQVLARL